MHLLTIPNSFKILVLHMGHVLCSINHGSTQCLWNSWLQGRVRSVSPDLYSSKQTAQELFDMPSSSSFLLTIREWSFAMAFFAAVVSRLCFTKWKSIKFKIYSGMKATICHTLSNFIYYNTFGHKEIKFFQQPQVPQSFKWVTLANLMGTFTKTWCLFKFLPQIYAIAKDHCKF